MSMVGTIALSVWLKDSRYGGLDLTGSVSADLDRVIQPGAASQGPGAEATRVQCCMRRRCGCCRYVIPLPSTATKGSGRGSTDSFKVKGYSEGNDDKDHDQWEPDREGHLWNKGNADTFRRAAGNPPWPSAAVLSVSSQPQDGGGCEEATRK